MRKLIGTWFCILAFCSSAWAQDPKIAIKDHLFVPASITIAAGTKVTWVNKDADPHTVVDQNNAFHSSALDTNDSYSHTFTAPGTYTYFCTLHPTMIGTIVVK
jgi:plastocyanin